MEIIISQEQLKTVIDSILSKGYEDKFNFGLIGIGIPLKEGIEEYVKRLSTGRITETMGLHISFVNISNSGGVVGDAVNSARFTLSPDSEKGLKVSEVYLLRLTGWDGFKENEITKKITSANEIPECSESNKMLEPKRKLRIGSRI